MSKPGEKAMKIIRVNRGDIRGGAGRTARRLYRALRDRGVDNKFLVNRKYSTDKNVLAPCTRMDLLDVRWAGKIDHYIRKFFTSRRTGFHPAVASGNLVRRIKREIPDIVHFNNVARDMLRIESIPRISLPIV